MNYLPTLTALLVALAATPTVAVAAAPAAGDPVTTLTRPVGDDPKAIRARGKLVKAEIGRLTARQQGLARKAAASKARLKALDAEIADTERKLAAHKAKHGEPAGRKK